MSIPDVRSLTDKERELIHFLLDHGSRAAASYANQLPKVSVVGRCDCGCPTIELAVDGRAASPRSPSAILAEAAGRSPEGVSVLVILHAREGKIAELEIAPLGDEGEFSIPRIKDLDVYDL
jgi:hypothetical protein